MNEADEVKVEKERFCLEMRLVWKTCCALRGEL